MEQNWDNFNDARTSHDSFTHFLAVRIEYGVHYNHLRVVHIYAEKCVRAVFYIFAIRLEALKDAKNHNKSSISSMRVCMFAGGFKKGGGIRWKLARSN